MRTNAHRRDPYESVRDWAAATAAEADRPVVAVERTLYRFSEAIEREPGRTWVTYGRLAAETLTACRP